MRVFIGFEPSASAAYFILRESITRFNEEYVHNVHPIVQQVLRMAGVYARPHDPLASTEFTYTRFLVPYLSGYNGWSLFMDSDMLVRTDLGELFDSVQGRDDITVACVQHVHEPVENTKMSIDGVAKAQTQYPRKNWSSIMLFNCSHPACKALTPRVVNEATPAYLHRFEWAQDDAILPLDMKWNWLEGWNSKEVCPNPAIVHFTRGIPGIHDGLSDVPYADEFLGLARVLA